MQQIVAGHLSITVDQFDDGSEPGMHDLDLVRTDRHDALEVTAAADGVELALWKNLDGRWLEPSLVGGWIVQLRAQHVRVKTLRTQLPEVLRFLEETGCKRANSSTFPGASGPETVLTPVLRALHIIEVRQGSTDVQGSIYFTTTPRGGFVDDDGVEVVPWVSAFVSDQKQADVRQKLRRSGAQERHAFVVVPSMCNIAPSSVALYLQSESKRPPAATPVLPSEITDVWLADTSTFSTSGVYWNPDLGWQLFLKT